MEEDRNGNQVQPCGPWLRQIKLLFIVYLRDLTATKGVLL